VRYSYVKWIISFFKRQHNWLKHQSESQLLCSCQSVKFGFLVLYMRCGFEVPGMILLHAYLYTYSCWEESLPKYSPWAAMNLAKRCCHCWKYFWNSCCGIIFSAVVTFLCMSSVSWNLRPFKAYFIFGNNQKSFGAKSGEQGGCSFSVIDFWDWSFLIESSLWDGALSWWIIQYLTKFQASFYT